MTQIRVTSNKMAKNTGLFLEIELAEQLDPEQVAAELLSMLDNLHNMGTLHIKGRMPLWVAAMIAANCSGNVALYEPRKDGFLEVKPLTGRVIPVEEVVDF